MATTGTLPFLLLCLCVTALTAHARPCKIFFYTSTTTSYYPSDSLNPSLDSIYAFEKSHADSPKFFTFFLTTTKGPEDSHRPRVSSISLSLRNAPFHLYYPDHAGDKLAEQILHPKPKPSEETAFPLGVVSTRSIRDRTKDIMSVVGALLFGVGCGALTAATMFLIWSLFAPHRFEFEDSEGEDGDDDDDDENRKIGYVTIPDDDIDMIKKAIAAQKKNGCVAIPADVEA